MVKRKEISFPLLVLIVFGLTISMVLADPSGPNTFSVESQRRMNTSGLGGSADTAVWAGNISRISISGVSLTTHWAGFYGNISGGITLDDENNRTLYNWTNTNPRGEIFATTATSVNWSNGPASDEGLGQQNLRCFQMQDIVSNTSTEEDVNRTDLEATMGLLENDVDGIDETFTVAQGHVEFTVGSSNFSANHCSATRMFNSTEQKGVSEYVELILYDDSNDAVIYTALIANNSMGFIGGQTDWEMMVLENGNGTNTAPTTYYFYVELT